VAFLTKVHIPISKSFICHFSYSSCIHTCHFFITFPSNSTLSCVYSFLKAGIIIFKVNSRRSLQWTSLLRNILMDYKCLVFLNYLLKSLTENREIPNFLAYMISFAAAYLHDDGAFLLFYLDGSNVRRDISGYFKNYNFKIKDEWTIINCLHLANLVNPNKNVSVLHSLKLPSFIEIAFIVLVNFF
jgi:hypothetical protein